METRQAFAMRPGEDEEDGGVVVAGCQSVMTVVDRELPWTTKETETLRNVFTNELRFRRTVYEKAQNAV